MSIREVNPSSFEVDAIAEAQLQEELRSLFAVDTQNYLQKYSQLAQNLQPEAWRTDIQELYRCIHTIKGGAVTVAAEAVLQVSTALEDLLSDLRYLEVAPRLVDDHLKQVLLDAGELLTGVLVQNTADLEPILHQVKTLHHEVQERYLSHWDPQRQLHQDFAEQGLEMVVLELQIALERLPTEHLPDETSVPAATIDTAQRTLAQLHQIGEELHFAAGWAELLNQAEELFTHPEAEVWRSQWFQFFQALKTCAKQGGSPIAFDGAPSERVIPEETSFEQTAPIDLSVAIDFDNSALDGNFSEDTGLESYDIGRFLESEFLENEFLENKSLENESLKADPLSSDEATLDHVPDHFSDHALADFAGNFADHAVDYSTNEQSEPEIFQIDQVETEQDEGDRFEPLSFSAVQEWLDLAVPTQGNIFEFEPFDPEASDRETSEQISEQISEQALEAQVFDTQAFDLSASERLTPESAETSIDRKPQSALKAEPLSQAKTQAKTQAETQPERMPDPGKVQIPVSLEKLDRSAQYLIETLLALRSTQGAYRTLENQITQLVALAQEGVQSITRLRQIQDDYALLDLQSKQSPQGLNPERYRQGYTVINRLLETNLRLSEIGAEAGKMTEQITENLRSVDGSVIKLQNTIEDSRLVSFQSLGVRTKAILRDLVTRYGKPARLIILGEQTELDVSTARALEPALLHLIRNAYDHGLETVKERIAQGKPEQGTIVLSLRRRGNLFSLEFKDDGRGIDAEKIRSRAEASNFPLTQTATAEDLLQVICQPGFSSESAANEISGRGVGMDVVAAQVARLGGQLSLHTTPGMGTTLQLEFPAPRLLVPCVLVRAGDYTFAVPEDEIRTVTLLGSLDAVQNQPENGNSDSEPTNSHSTGSNPVYRWVVQNEASSTPVLDLLEYWQPHLAGRSLSDTAVCLLIETQAAQGSQAEGIWLLADELLEQSELVINLLPSPLTVPTGVLGVSLQVNGSLIPVLESRTLAEWWLALPARQSGSAAIDSADTDELAISRPAQTILVVDDAALMRRRLEASLSASGYAIHTCSDGQEAWHWLQEHPNPDLILTDIEMPNMDGFTLIDRCRQTGVTVPILVVSSRLSEEWFNEARRLGATDYLTKGFATVDLISKVNRLLSEV